MPCILHILHLCSICPGISLHTHLDCCFYSFYCQYTGNFMLMLYILEQSLLNVVVFAVKWRLNLRFEHSQSIWGLKLNTFSPGARLRALGFRNATSERVLKLLSQSAVKEYWVHFGERGASAGVAKSADTHSVVNQLPHQEAESQSTARKNHFQHFLFKWLQLRGLMFIYNVHLFVSTPDEEVCAHVRVCMNVQHVCESESPEVSCPGSCSVAPPRAPERQRQPLL